MRSVRSALAALLLAGPLAAQAPGDTLALGLDDALAIARGANPAVLRAENELALDAPHARATWLGQVVPQLTVNLLQTGYSGSLQRQATDFFGQPIENPESSWSYYSNTRQGFSLNWRIQGRSFLDARERQQQTSRGRALALASADAALEAEVQGEYWNALEQRQLLEVEEGLLEGRQRDLEAAERRYSLARATRVDVLQAEYALEQQRAEIQSQRSAYEQALLTLRTTLGELDLGAIRPNERDLPVFDPAGLDEDALVSRALGENPQVRSAEAGVDGARIGVSEATQWKWPELSIGYNWGQFSQTREAEALFDVGYDADRMTSSFSVALSVPFFNNYFQNRYSESQARVALQNQQESLKETRLQAEWEVRSQLIQLRNQFETLRLAERSLGIAEEALRLAREEYRIGTRTFEQLQDAVEQEVGSRRQVITSRFSFVDALIALESAVGGSVRPATGG
ncbi:TolC family protein [Gaopeijia maritima]|uniref:TolC family protein n=1 Tax=Gaopeijia maritima TaxID=3119007 RepID=UPI00324F17E7